MPTKTKPRPNFASCEELNAVLAQFKAEYQAEIAQLRSELAALKAQLSDLPGRAREDRVYQMSPLQQRRWQAIAAVRNRLKAGEAEATVQAFLSETYPDMGVEGILKIAMIQAGKRT